MKSYATVILILWLEIFAISLLLAGIIVGSYGAATYLKNCQDEQNYRLWKTICYVRNYTLTSCDCYDQCPCFAEEFLVEYEIFNKTNLLSRIQTKTRTISTRKSNGTCYYNGRYNLTSVKWDYEDKMPGLILFRIGYGMIALLFPIMVIIFKVFYSHISPSFVDNHLYLMSYSVDHV